MAAPPTSAARALLDAADRLEAHLTCPSVKSGRYVAAPAAPSVDLDTWRLHVTYHRRRRDDDRRRLVERYHATASRLSRRYLRQGEPKDDLEQVALEALLLAIERFDPSRSLPFLGYANPTIVGALKRYYRDAGWALRVPRWAHELSSAIRDAGELLTHDLGRAPTEGEIADLLGVEVADVIATQAAQRSRSATSLSAPPPGTDGAVDGTTSLEGTLASDDRDIERAEERVTIEAVVRLLDPRARELLGLYFQDGLTQAQIADRLGISQMQISRRLSQVLEQLRSHLPNG